MADVAFEAECTVEDVIAGAADATIHFWAV
jgi:hypothetical protein